MLGSSSTTRMRFMAGVYGAARADHEPRCKRVVRRAGDGAAGEVARRVTEPRCPTGHTGMPERRPGTACGAGRWRGTIHPCAWVPGRPIVPEHAELLDRDALDAIHRRTDANGANPSVPVVDDPAVGIRPIQSSGPAHGSHPVALPRAMGPAAFMAMQRLAGNRAVIRALGGASVQRVGLLDLPRMESDEVQNLR